MVNMTDTDTLPTILVDVNSGRQYHPGEDIDGSVSVTFYSDTEVSAVQAKLIGTSYTSIRGNRWSLPEATESHELIYDICTVFPPQEYDSNILRNQTCLMMTGQVLFEPFNFRIPMHAHCGDKKARLSSYLSRSQREQKVETIAPKDVEPSGLKHQMHIPLPPTFDRYSEDGKLEAVVMYCIQVVVRSANFTVHASSTTPITVVPQKGSLVHHVIPRHRSDTVRVQTNKDGSSRTLWSALTCTPSLSTDVMILAVMPDQLSSEPLTPLVFALTKEAASSARSTGTVTIQWYDITLETTTYTRSGESINRMTSIKTLTECKVPKSFSLGDIRPVKELVEFPWLSSLSVTHALNISDNFGCFEGVGVDHSFSICNISHQHTLKLRMKISSSNDDWFPRSLKFEGPLDKA